MYRYIITLIVTWIWYICFNHPGYEEVNYQSLIHKFKTGDIILFHAIDNLNTAIIGSYYGHIGIVYKKNNKLYIFEAFKYNKNKNYLNCNFNGVELSDLENRLKTYKGYCFYKELAKPVSVKNVENFEHFMKYALNNMRYQKNVIFHGIDKILCGGYLGEDTNCGELAYLSLISLGVLPSYYYHINKRHHLKYLANMTHTEGGNNFYKKPYYITFKYFI